MTEPASIPRVSVTLTGKMMHFNITVGCLLFALVAVLWISSASENPVLSYGGTAMALSALLAVVVFVIRYYSKQEVRPLDGQPSTVSITSRDGHGIIVQNPPDRALDPVEIRALMRCVVGYDRNMEPDGEVIGKASEANYRLFSDDEKRILRSEHEDKIRGKITIAEELIANAEDHDLPDAPDGSQVTTEPS
jgi:hypothetical protein